MKKCSVFLFLGLSILLLPGNANAWGFYAHRIINRMAVYALPPEMFGFFKHHIDYVTVHAVDPDKRRYSDSLEAPRHYIDLDYFEKALPIDTMPFYFNDAKEKYTYDTLFAYGLVPWHIQEVYNRLKNAFLNKNVESILRLSADLGHYLADAHVPLHATINYNGQLSNQVGIHAFFESRLPELYATEYNFFVGKATYSNSALKTAWGAVYGSFGALDSVFLFERKAGEQLSESERYVLVNKNGNVQKNYSDAYAQKYHQMLNNMVERRMRGAVLAISSLWYSAWVDAGQPNLIDLISGDKPKPSTAKEIKEMQETEQSQIQNLKMIGRQE